MYGSFNIDQRQITYSEKKWTVLEDGIHGHVLEVHTSVTLRRLLQKRSLSEHVMVYNIIMNELNTLQ